MADWNKIEAQMRKLISDANETTGKNDTNLTDVVDGLISGYGQGIGSDYSILYELTEPVTFNGVDDYIDTGITLLKEHEDFTILIYVTN